MGDEINYPEMVQDYLNYMKSKHVEDESEQFLRIKTMARKLEMKRMFRAGPVMTLSRMQNTHDLVEAMRSYTEADFACLMLTPELERHLREEASNVHREGLEDAELARAAVYALNQFIQSRRFPISLDAYNDLKRSAASATGEYELGEGRTIEYHWLGFLRYRRVAGLVAKPSSNLFLDAWREGDLLVFAVVNSLGGMTDGEFGELTKRYHRVEVRDITRFFADIQRIPMEKFING